MELKTDMLTHGVYMVCAQHEGKQAGLTIAWATQVARDKLLISIGRRHATTPLILASQAFGLSILTKEQRDLAFSFGRRSSRDVDKLQRVGHHAGLTGSPLLDECGATLDCQVESIFESGSSQLIIGKVVAAERCRETYEPLIYREEDY